MNPRSARRARPRCSAAAPTRRCAPRATGSARRSTAASRRPSGPAPTPAPCPRSRWRSSAHWCRPAAANSPITRSPTGWPMWCGLILAGAGRDEPGDRHRMTVHVGDHELVLDPYDYDFHEDPYPYYKRLRDEAPLYRNEELGFWALSRHQRCAARVPQQHHAVQPRRRLAGPGVTRTARVEDDVVSGDGRSRPICGCARWCRKASRPAPDSRARAAGHRARRAAPRRHAGEGGRRKPSTTSANSPASCRWT